MKQLTLFDPLEDSGDLGAGEGKLCSKCNQYLPLSDYCLHSGGSYLRTECRKCNAELFKVRKSLRLTHGMPKEGYICPICKQNAEGVKGQGNTRNGPWVLDHCHKTSNFRGWLCHKCNRALGGFNDDKETLKLAIEYLSSNQ